jgi:hypothetical protein
LLQNSVKKDLFKALRHRQVIGNSKNNFFDWSIFNSLRKSWNMLNLTIIFFS